MDKLTIEVLKEIIGSYPEGSDEIECLMAQKLLAYEQAAEKPYGYLEPYDFPRTTATLYPEKDRYAVMPIYSAPVLPKQPVSEPYKFHQGWIKGQFAYQDLFNAIGAAVVSKHPSIEISVKAFEDSMIAAAPAHTLSEHSAAIKDVITERQRQVSEEGWTPAHDDQYADCELTQAAICYIDTSFAETNWPWAAEWWKPTNPRRDLVKAGALILAEIERLDRAAPAQESE